MTERVHVYETMIAWGATPGQGTTSPVAYDRAHVVRGEGKPELAMSADPAFRGDPKAYNPEELLVASVASCHMLWYLALCAKASIIVTAYEDRPIGRLVEGKPGGGRFESVQLRPVATIAAGDSESARPLHDDAHRACFISNSVNFPVTCEPKFVLARGRVPARATDLGA
jgi:organic hydroperoxide reductase OsmC/OhrA